MLLRNQSFFATCICARLSALHNTICYQHIVLLTHSFTTAVCSAHLIWAVVKEVMQLYYVVVVPRCSMSINYTLSGIITNKGGVSRRGIPQNGFVATHGTIPRIRTFQIPDFPKSQIFRFSKIPKKIYPIIPDRHWWQSYNTYTL